MTCTLSLCKNTSFLKATANVIGKILMQNKWKNTYMTLNWWCTAHHCRSSFLAVCHFLPSSANTLASRSVVAVSIGPPPVLNRSILSSAAVFFKPFLMLLYAYCAQLKQHIQITISITRLIYMQSNVLATLDIAPLITVAKQTDLTSLKIAALAVCNFFEFLSRALIDPVTLTFDL